MPYWSQHGGQWCIALWQQARKFHADRIVGMVHCFPSGGIAIVAHAGIVEPIILLKIFLYGCRIAKNT
jgi:hypothetical protein